MDFKYNAEQQALVDCVARFGAREYGFEKRQRLIANELGFSRAHWRFFAELGWLGAGLPKQLGGHGGGPIETMIIMEGAGRVLMVEPILANTIFGLQIVAVCPEGAKRDALTSAIVAGEKMIAPAHGEAFARGDDSRIKTGFRNGKLVGEKSLVFGAPAADVLLVSVCKGDQLGVYMVDPNKEGVRLRSYRTLDNARVADIVFEDAAIECELAHGPAAWSAIHAAYAHAVIGLCAEAVGAMDKVITATCEYLKTRRQFGTTLSNFQALQHRMADMLVEMELSRSILYQGIAVPDEPEAYRRPAISAMRSIVSSAALFVGRNAIQLHGRIGMTKELAVGHYYRRLFVIAGQYGAESLHLRSPAGMRPHSDPSSEGKRRTSRSFSKKRFCSLRYVANVPTALTNGVKVFWFFFFKKELLAF